MKSSGAAVFTRQNPFPPARPVGRSHYHPSSRTDSLSQKKRHTSLSPVLPTKPPHKQQPVKPEEKHLPGGAERPCSSSSITSSSIITEEQRPCFSESWPSTEQSRSPNDMETFKPSAGSGDLQDSVLAKFVDRFRHGRPQSRAERQQRAEEPQSFWWMRDPSPLPCSSTPTQSPHKAVPDHHSGTPSPVRHHSSPPSPCTDTLEFTAMGLSDSSHVDLVDPEILRLQERASRLLLRSEGSVSSESVPISSEGLGCSEFSSPVSTDEPVRRAIIPSAMEPVTAGTLSSASLHVASSAPRPADDILFQWRLRRKMESARQWAPPPTQSPQYPAQQQSQSFQYPAQQQSQYPAQQQSQSFQYPAQQQSQYPAQQQSQYPAQQQSQSFQYPAQQQSQYPAQQQSQSPQYPAQQQSQYPAQQQSQSLQYPAQEQSQSPQYPAQQQSQYPAQQQSQDPSSQTVRPPSRPETQQTPSTGVRPRPSATPISSPTLSRLQSGDAQAHVPAHMHLLCDVLPCPARSPPPSKPRHKHLPKPRTRGVAPPTSSSEEEEFGKRVSSRPSWPLQPASSVTTEEEEWRGAERNRQEKQHRIQAEKKKTVVSSRKNKTSTRHAVGGGDHDDTGCLQHSRGSRKAPTRPQRPRGDRGQRDTYQGTSRGQQDTYQGTSRGQRDTYQGTSRGQRDTYQGTSIEDRTGDRAPPPSPIHCALGQVVSEVLFPPTQRRRSPVSSDSSPPYPTPPAPPPQSPAPPPPDLQHPLEVITQLLQEAQDSDETEFEDDPLLQVLRKQRQWVKDQISEVDSMLEEFQQLNA